MTLMQLAAQVILAAAILLSPGATRAQGSVIVPIPEELSTYTRPDVVSRRESLLRQRFVMLVKMDSHNLKCSRVPEDSPLVTECKIGQTSLADEIRTYQKAVIEFNHMVKTMVAVTPHSDTMVVDARKVPSGLPKSVDSAIPDTPSGYRVRKGFEAIQDGDWKVALAWFKDARLKEPSDPGIVRLVDLAEFTLEYRTRTPAPKNGSTPSPAQRQEAPNQSTSVKSGDGTTNPFNDDLVARSTASQMAARARADTAFKKYVEKYGDRDIPGRIREVQGAMRGDGYTDEELKAQLQKALIDYRNNYRKNHPNRPDNSVGGSPAAEEIVLGGKG